MIQRRGRAPGPGRLARAKRGKGPPRWVLCWTDAAGKRLRHSLSTDRRVAERLRSEIIHQRDLELAGLGGEAGLDRPLRELVDAYLGDLKTRCCPRHVLNVRSELAEVLAAVPVERVGDLKPLMLVQYRTRRLAEGVSVRTANLACDRLRACLNWCVRLDLLAKNPIQKLPRLKETEATARYRRRALSEAEIAAFLAAAAEDDRRVAEDGTLRGHARVPQAPLFRWLIESGARYGETIQVAWADTDLDNALVTLRATTTKAHRERQIPLLPRLVGDLRTLREKQAVVLRRPLRPGDRVFAAPEGGAWPTNTVRLMKIFDRVLEAAGIDRLNARGEKLDLHALRHACASRLARAGVPITHTQRLLGHSSVELTVKHYTHLDLADLRSAIARLQGQRPVAVEGGRSA